MTKVRLLPLIWALLAALVAVAASTGAAGAGITPTRPTNGKHRGSSWRLTLDEQFDNDLNPSLWTKGWSWYDGHNHSRPRMHTKASDTCWFDDRNVRADALLLGVLFMMVDGAIGV